MRPLTTRAFAIALAAAFLLGGAAALVAWRMGERGTRDAAASAPLHPRWREVAWPFAMDEWGQGVAFRCAAADCGSEINVYLRPKIGFCNCTTGVADDDELDRLSDFNLLGPKVMPRGAGHEIKVAWMNGRARAFALPPAGRTSRAAISAAFNDRCDAIVATVTVAHENPEGVEPGVLAFLNGPTVTRWAEKTLGM